MVTTIDKLIYYPKSFNEQMAWIGEEVEHIIKYDNEYSIKKNIQEAGRNAYGMCEYTHAINKLFAIVKSDPKNQAVLHEVCRAEQELISFLYDDSGALSEGKIYEYWNTYMKSYMAELDAHKMHFVLMKKYELQGKNDECIGSYGSIAKLQEAYYTTAYGLRKNKESLIINAYDEFSGQWIYNIEPEKCFVGESLDVDKYRMIEFVVDNPYMHLFKLDKIKRNLAGYVYDNECMMLRDENSEYETINIKFDVEYSYQILERLDSYWGGWNGTCPEASKMAEIAKVWYEKYDAELVKISHDTLTFTCRKLSELEATNLIEECTQLYAMVIDCEPELVVNHLMENETFTLWWD